MKKTTFLILIAAFIVLPVNAQRYGACIINGCIVTDFNGTFEKRFEMNSVMKFPQALYVAHFLDSMKISLNDSVLINRKDLMTDTWSPMLNMIEEEKKFSYGELLALSLQQSDNNACDLLFSLCALLAKYSST